MAATVLGSSVAILDATVVNIAVPGIGSDLGAGVTGLTSTVNTYTLTLAAFVLVGGALGDRFGRRRVFMLGVAWFGLASVACGLAADIGMLVALRGLQGVGAALLTPGALAILQAASKPKTGRGRSGPGRGWPHTSLWPGTTPGPRPTAAMTAFAGAAP